MTVRAGGAEGAVTLRPGFTERALRRDTEAVRCEEERSKAERVLWVAMVEDLLGQVGWTRAPRNYCLVHGSIFVPG